MNRALPHLLRNSVEDAVLCYRSLFYNAMSAYIKSKFSRIYPKLGLNIRFIPLRARMINAEFLTRFFLRSEEHTSELQSRPHLVCRLLLEKKKKKKNKI